MRQIFIYSLKVLFTMLLTSIGIQHSLHGQELSRKELRLIERNIITFHFRHAKNFDLKLNGEVLRNDQIFFNELWPTDEHPLVMQVEHININYPEKKNLKFFHLTINSFRLENDTTSRYTFLSMDFDKEYLVALDPSTHKISFLSGNFFLSACASHFKLDTDHPQSFFDFIKIRYFSLGIRRLKFEKSDKDHLIFSVLTSDFIDPKCFIYVDKSNFDLTSYRFLTRSFVIKIQAHLQVIN